MSAPRPNIARRRQEKKRKRQERLKRKQAQRPFGAPTATAEWDGLEKMSDVLEAFVEPYMEMATDERGYRNLLNLGMAAWNAALLLEETRIATLDDLFRKHEVSGASRALMQELIDRKKAYFSTNRRSIIGFVLTDTGDGYYLNVVSTLPVPPASQEFSPGEA